ncbi:hypothetical protein [Flindersiella endophytica]
MDLTLTDTDRVLLLLVAEGRVTIVVGTDGVPSSFRPTGCGQLAPMFTDQLIRLHVAGLVVQGPWGQAQLTLRGIEALRSRPLSQRS